MHLSGMFSRENAKRTAEYMEMLVNKGEENKNRERTREMIKVMYAYVGGGPVEVRNNMSLEWHSTDCPDWDWLRYDYRIASSDKPDSINWDHVAPDFKWMARGPDGISRIYIEEPVKRANGWASPLSINANVLTSYQQGTCDWEDSLVERTT